MHCNIKILETFATLVGTLHKMVVKEQGEVFLNPSKDCNQPCEIIYQNEIMPHGFFKIAYAQMLN